MKLSAQAEVVKNIDNALTVAMVRHQKAYEKMEDLKRELVDIEKAIRIINDLQRLLPKAAIEEYAAWVTERCDLAAKEAEARCGRA
jgi:hypothetical protein